MAGLLQRWLNEDVRLSREVLDVAADFSSGYLLGELCFRYKVQEDFSSFVDNESAEGKIHNFMKLLPTFQHLGLQKSFSSNVVNAIMTEKPGVASRLLLELKGIFETAPRARRFDTAPSSRRSGRNERVRDASALLGTRNPKQKFDELEESYFRQRLMKFAQLAHEQKVAELHLKKFNDQEKKQREEQRQQEELEHTMKLEERATRHATIREHLHETQQFLRDWDKELATRHRDSLKVKKNREEQDLRYELERTQRKAAREAGARSKEATDVSNGIDDFEKTLERLGVDAKKCRAPIPDEDVTSVLGKTVKSKNAVEHVQKLQTRVTPKEQLQDEADRYFSRVRAKKLEDTEARREREKRRRKVLLEQEQLAAQTQDQRERANLIQRLLRESKEEQRVGADLQRRRMEKEVFRQNRLLRERKIAERREKDYEEAMERERLEAVRLREEKERKLEMERERLEAVRAAEVAAKHSRAVKFCKDTVKEIANLAIRAGEFRSQRKVDDVDLNQSSRAVIPASEWQQWMHLFLTGEHVLPPTVQPEEEAELDQPTSTRVELMDEDESAAAVLDDAGLSDYIAGRLLWSDADHAVADALDTEAPADEYVSWVIHDIQDIAHPPPPQAPPPEIPDAPVRAVFYGQPLCNKSLCAAALDKRHGVDVITPVDVISQAMALLDGDDDSDVAGVGLAAAAQKELKHGGAVSDELLARLTVHHIRKIAHEQDEAGHKSGGWVIDGYPMSLLAMRSLERELSGYWNEADDPDPDGKKKKKAPRTGTRGKLRSGQSGSEVSTPGTDATPAIDLAICFAAPSEDSVLHVLSDDLVGEETEPRSTVDVHEQLRVYAKNVDAINAWFGKLGSLRKVEVDPASEDTDATVECALSLFREVAAAKEAKNAAAKQSQDIPEVPARLPSEPELQDAGEGVSPTDSVDKKMLLNVPAASGSPKTGSDGKPESARTTDEQIAAQIEEEMQRVLVEWKPEVAETMLDQYNLLKSYYEEGLRRVFRAMRRKSRLYSVRLAGLVTEYRSFLRRPDTKQGSVWDFQREYNACDADQRMNDPEAKAYFHERVEDVQELLWEAEDARRAENEKEILRLQVDPWLEDARRQWLNLVFKIIQLEADRFLDVVQIVRDYWDVSYGKELGQASSGSQGDKPAESTLKKSHSSNSTSNIADAARHPPVFPIISLLERASASRGGSTVAKKALSKSAMGSSRALLKEDKGELSADNVVSGTVEDVDARMKELEKAVDDRLGQCDILLSWAKQVERYFLEYTKSPQSPSEAVPTDSDETDADDARANPRDCPWTPHEGLAMVTARFQWRLQQLKAYAINGARGMSSMTHDAYNRLFKWSGRHYRRNLAAVRAVVKHLHDAVESGILANQEIVIEGDNVTLNEHVLLAKALESPDLPLPEETRLSRKCPWTARQLRMLIDAFACVSGLGTQATMDVDDAVHVLMNLKSCRSLEAFPAGWGRLSAELTRSLLTDFACDGQFNWRLFLALILFPCMRVTPSEVERIAIAAQQAGGFPIVRASVVQDILASADSGIHELQHSSADEWALFLRIFRSSHAVKSAAESDEANASDVSQFDCNVPLLLKYFCYDISPSIAVQKLVVLASNGNERATVDSVLDVLAPFMGRDLSDLRLVLESIAVSVGENSQSTVSASDIVSSADVMEFMKSKMLLAIPCVDMPAH